jgi:hypothetical protein
MLWGDTGLPFVTPANRRFQLLLLVVAIMPVRTTEHTHTHWQKAYLVCHRRRQKVPPVFRTIVYKDVVCMNSPVRHSLFPTSTSKDRSPLTLTELSVEFVAFIFILEFNSLTQIHPKNEELSYAHGNFADHWISTFVHQHGPDAIHGHKTLPGCSVSTSGAGLESAHSLWLRESSGFPGLGSNPSPGSNHAFHQERGEEIRYEPYFCSDLRQKDGEAVVNEWEGRGVFDPSSILCRSTESLKSPFNTHDLMLANLYPRFIWSSSWCVQIQLLNEWWSDGNWSAWFPAAQPDTGPDWILPGEDGAERLIKRNERYGSEQPESEEKAHTYTERPDDQQ